jgi:hypothetical protein
VGGIAIDIGDRSMRGTSHQAPSRQKHRCAQ